MTISKHKKEMDICEVPFCRNTAEMTWLEHRICHSCYAKDGETINLKELLGDAK